MAFNPREQERLAAKGFDAVEMVVGGLNRRAPWDSIVDFAIHPSFCGFPIFPRQATLLKLIFLETEQMTQYDVDVINEWRKGFTLARETFGVQPDIWQRVEYLKQRGYRRFPHIQMVLGRRASKGAMGGLLACEQIAYLHSLDDPQAVYGVARGKDVYLNVGGTSQTQAARQLFADVRTMVEQCKYFRPDGQPPWIAESKDAILRIRTPADLRRISEMKVARIPIDHQIASLVGVALATNSVSGRGQTSFANLYDEFAFHVQTGSSKSDTEIYHAWQPSLGQFGNDSLTYIPSSPATKAGQFYVLYQSGRVLMSSYSDETGMADEARQNLMNVGRQAELDCDPSWLIFQGSSWDLYRDWRDVRRVLGVRYKFDKSPEPDLTDERQIRERLRDPDKFRVEKQGQFGEVLDQYLDSDKVDAMYRDPDWREPLAPQAYGTFDRKYRIHCDPGRTGANFSLAVAHLEDAPPDEHGRVWPHVVFDFLKVWRPMDFPEDAETHKRTIDYVQVHSDIDDILSRFMSTEKISFDQWNCLAGSTLVPTARGLLRVDEIVGDEVPVGKVVDLNLGVESHTQTAVIRQGFHKGVVPTRKITTKLGNTIEITPEHRLWVRKAKARPWHADEPWGYEVGGNIEVGDWLCLKRNTMLPSEEFDLTNLPNWTGEWSPGCDEALGEALGLLVAEGDYTDLHCRFGNSDDELVERYRTLMEKSFGGTWTSKTVDDWMGKYHWGTVRKGGRIPRFLRQLGLSGRATEKAVPWVIRTSPAEVVKAFLRGYFEGDGGVCFGREGEVWIEATTTSYDIAEVVQQLLLSIGVFSTLWSGTYRYRGEVRDQWRIKMYGLDLLDFADEVGFSCSRKQQELVQAVNVVQGSSGRGVGLRSKHQRHGDEYWVRVSRIEDSVTDCYDLSVPGPESYIANGVVSHNSASFIASLRQKFMPGIRVVELPFTEKENQVRCEKFKSALNLGWIHCFPDSFYLDNESCLLELELKFLSERNGRVVKQDTGPVVTKDLADAVMVVAVDLLRDALDRWSSDRLTAGAYGSSNVSGLKSGREMDKFMEDKTWRPASEVIQERRAMTDGRHRRGRYEPSSLNSIHTREPKTPKGVQRRG